MKKKMQNLNKLCFFPAPERVLEPEHKLFVRQRKHKTTAMMKQNFHFVSQQ